MTLRIGVDATGADPAVRDLLEDLQSALQQWSQGLGRWTDVAYVTSTYSSEIGTWTVEEGDQRYLRWMVIGDTMWINFNVTQTTLASTPPQLRIAVPGGYTAFPQEATGFVFASGTTAELGVVLTLNDSLLNVISIQRTAGTGWPNSTDAQNFRGSICFQVYRTEVIP